MTLKVKAPRNYRSERHYIFSVILDEAIGLPFHLDFCDCNQITIGDETHSLTINDTLFAGDESQWPPSPSRPNLPLANLGLAPLLEELPFARDEVPVLFGEPRLEISKKHIHLGLDIFGSAFFMLSRLEEFGSSQKDEHERFPLSASVAFQAGFHQRPIINEYVAVLRACLQTLWPGLELRNHQFRMTPSHDVDDPFLFLNMPVSKITRQCLAKTFRKGQVGSATSNGFAWLQSKLSGGRKDPYNNFSYIMDQSEKRNLKSAFYFITDNSLGFPDGDYSMNQNAITELITQMKNRGHEIGLHGSYHSYNRAEKIKAEFQTLQQAAKACGVPADQWGGRQHYLRYDPFITWRIWDQAGLNYDSTVGFVEEPGFRSGYCYDYPVYDLDQRRPLNLREFPMVAMDVSVMNEPYMGLGTGQEAFHQFQALKQECRNHGGHFTLLWHNNYFQFQHQRDLYEAVLDC